MKKKVAVISKSSPSRTYINPALILTSNVNFDVWRCVVETELKGINYADVLEEIDENEFDEKEERINFVSAYILARVDDSFKPSLCGLKTPNEMLKKLEDLLVPKTISTLMIQKRRFNQIVMKPGEGVLPFSNRFEAEWKRLVQQGGEIDPNEVAGNFAIAVMGVYPEISNKFDANPELTLDDLTKLALNMEMSIVESKERIDGTEKATSATVNAADVPKSENKDKNVNEKKIPVCHRCGRRGHLVAECFSQKKLCYNCGKLGSHIAEECTSRPQVLPFNTKRRGNRGHRFQRGRGRGFASGRGFGFGYGRGFGYNRGVGYSRGSGMRGFNRGHNAALYRKVKIRGQNGQEKIALMSVRDNSAYEIAEANVVQQGRQFSKIIAKENTLKCIGDSGATEHIVSEPDFLVDKEILKNGVIKGINKNVKADLVVESKGKLLFRKDSGEIITLDNVLQTKGVSKNILSLRRFVKQGINVLLSDKYICLIERDTGKVIKRGIFDGTFWWLDLGVEKAYKRRNEDILNKRSKVGTSHDGNVGENIERIILGTSHDKNIYENIENIIIPEENEGSNLGTSWQSLRTSDVNENIENIIPEEEVEKQMELEKEVSFRDIDSTQSLEKYLESVSEMKLEDIAKLEKSRVESLKNNIGFLWHLRLGHVSKTYLEKASQYIPELKGVKFDNSIENCRVCIMAKAKKNPCITKRFMFSQALDLIHTDLMGPILPESFEYGNKYIVTFTDDATRYVWAYPLPDKTTVHLAVLNLLENIRKIKGQNARIKTFRLDNGTEYLTQNMKNLLDKEKINYDPVPAYTPNLNGVSERLNYELQKKIRCLIFDSGFSKDMWSYALNYAVSILNRTPKKTLEGRIPYELFHEKPCTIKYFRRFGCLAHILRTDNIGKFDARTLSGFLVGCRDDSYVIFDCIKGKFWR